MSEHPKHSDPVPPHPCCPDCGSKEVYLDCTAYWCVAAQTWVMSDGNDNEATCPQCDWNGRMSELSDTEAERDDP